VHHFTNRMYAYLSRISITESYDTVSSIFDVSKATVKRMYLSYIRSLMLRKQVGKAKKIIIGDVLVKSTFCRWVADAEMFELIYLMPDCSNDELIERLKGYYGDICPEIIYCSPERELVSLLSKTFEKSVIAIDVVALREVAYSTMSAYKRKYKMSTDLTSEFKDNISIRPYDVNFMNKYLWCKDLLSMTDRNCQLFSVKKHISIGKGQFGDMLWIPYSVFEYCPELLQTYYRNPFNENVKVEYAKFKDVVGKANKCKSLQRAIERILFADKFDKIHNVVSEVEQEKVEVELDSYSGIQKLFNSERYKGLDLYHKMELLKSENVDLYDKALRYF